jgi:16S rRNA processing protein RimM
MKTLPLTDAFASLVPEMTVYLHTRDETCLCTIKSLRKMNRYYILSCNEISDRDRASLFRGAAVLAPPAFLPRAEGEYLREEIIGLTVVTTDGEEIGRIADIIAMPAHDVYVVAAGDREYLIPAVREFIAEILPDEGRLIVKKMEGLFD